MVRTWMAGAAVVALALSLAACSSGAPAATPKPAIEQFAEIPGVVKVAPYNESATVSMGVDASDDEVLAAAASVASIAIDADWVGTVSLERENVAPYDAEQDVSTRPPWTLQVFPVADTTLPELTQMLLLEKLEGTATVTVLDGWPYVSVQSVEGLAESFRVIAANPLFADGGTVRQGDEHLSIVWIPKRTSLHAIDEIISIATDYPDAEVLLQATTEGPQWPTLYIARLSAEDAAAIQERLLDPSLADADVDGYGLPFILTSIGADGPVYLDGNLGGVVEG